MSAKPKAEMAAGRFFLRIFGAFGALFSVIGLLIGLSMIRDQQRIQTAEGVVVDLLPTQTERSLIYRPVVAFTPADGRALRFTDTSGANPPIHQIEQRVRVFYLPDDPETSAALAPDLSRWILPAAFLLFGALFGGIGFAARKLR
jgi:Protein of unknown function (DUF3592)